METLLSKISVLPSVNCRDSEIKEMPLYQMLFDIMNGKYKEVVEAVRNEKDEAKQKELKAKLPCFMPSGTFSGKAEKDLKYHSGYLCLDIDERDNKDLEDFAMLKEEIKSIPYVMYCVKSCRGKGYMCLIPIDEPTLHRQYFRTLQHAFAKANIQIDKSCVDVSRKRFVTYDPQPYINTGAQVFSVIEPTPKSQRETEPQHVKGDAETRAKVEALVGVISTEGIDICGDYNQWFSILSSLANEFGEDGREYAQAISEQGATYKSPDDVDKRYNDALKHSKLKYTIATFFKFAEDGIREYKLKHDFEHITKEANNDEI